LRVALPDARSVQQAFSFSIYRAAEASGYFSPVVARTGMALTMAQPGRGNPESAARVLASRESSVWRATGSSPAHGSGPADSLVLLQGGRGPGFSGAESPRFSSPDLPLASTVSRSAENELRRAASPEKPDAPGEVLHRAITTTEVGSEGQTSPSPTAPPTGLDIEELIDRVTKRLMRQLSIERERKGFTPWL